VLGLDGFEAVEQGLDELQLVVGPAVEGIELGGGGELGPRGGQVALLHEHEAQLEPGGGVVGGAGDGLFEQPPGGWVAAAAAAACRARSSRWRGRAPSAGLRMA